MQKDRETKLGKMRMHRKQETQTWSKAEGTSNESGISIVKLVAAGASSPRSLEADRRVFCFVLFYLLV